MNRQYEKYGRSKEEKRQYGFLAKHSTTGQAIQSPYVAMSQNYMTQTSRLWNEIFQVVKENCSTGYKGESPQDDLMEMLLKKRAH